MKMFIILVSVLLFFHEGQCSNLYKRSERTDRSNQFIDDFLENTKAENRHKIEPYLPEDISYGFEQKVTFVNVNGELLFKDISISGITSIYRDGDSTMTKNGDVVKISCDLGMGVLELYSKIKLSFMKMGYTLTLDGEIGHVTIHVEASQDTSSGESPTIDKLQIYDMKGMKVKISGLGPMNFLLNKITDITLKIFKGKIRSKLEDKLKEVFEDNLENTNFPEF